MNLTVANNCQGVFAAVTLPIAALSQHADAERVDQQREREPGEGPRPLSQRQGGRGIIIAGAAVTSFPKFITPGTKRVERASRFAGM